MKRQDVTNELIDRRLEFLYQRWVQADYEDSGWLTADAMGVWLRRKLETMYAYLESTKRYGRQAPSMIEEKRRENAAWN